MSDGDRTANGLIVTFAPSKATVCGYVQSTAFVLDPEGKVLVSVYSSGAIGRLVPEDVIGLVRYLREHAAASACVTGLTGASNADTDLYFETSAPVGDDSDRADTITGRTPFPMTVTVGILALLEARAGKSDELAAFLEAGRQLALAEEGTVTWYAFKISDTSYGIFDTFVSDDGRTAHLNGEIPAALGAVAADLLAGEPAIRLIDVLAVK